MNKNTNDIDKLWDLIKSVEVAMLTSKNSDGSLRSRPMVAQQTSFDGFLWFFTHASAHKVDEINQHHQVNIAYVDHEKNRYVSVSGHAQVVRDATKAKELWRPYLRAWFPGGVDDADVAMLRVKVDKAEYWDSPSSKVVELLGFAKSLLTGDKPEPPTNRKISISR